MNKKINDRDLIDDKRVDEKYIVLFQVWKELTDNRTLDSYQYRVMNTLSAIKELVDVLNNSLLNIYKSNANVEECTQETKNIIKSDDVLKKYFFVCWKTLLEHLSQKADKDTKQRALRYQLEYLYGLIAPTYFEMLVKELELCIEGNDVGGIVRNADRVVSNCVTRGWSTNALYNVIEALYDSQGDSQKWDDFKEKILKGQPDEYHVLIPLKVRIIGIGNTHQANEEKLVEHIKSSGMNVLSYAEIMDKYDELNNISKSEYYLDIEIQAYDFYSASHMALSKYANILNMFSFYNVIEAWTIKDISWNVVNTNNNKNKKIVPKTLYGTYGYLEGASNILLKSLNLSKIDNSINARLFSTYSYANMSRASYSLEEKYMNMWVALESLSRSNVYDNIISNVLECVPAALCRRYLFRKIRNFAEDCIRCNVDYKFSSKIYNIKNTNKSEVVKYVIEIMGIEELYVELLNKCKINGLLEYRCVELHTLMNDDTKLSQSVKKHYNNVKQQLSRLYRVRNSIAHTAEKEDVQMVRYIEHLEDYLSEFVSEIIRIASEKNVEEIEIILEMIKDNYKQFESLTEAKNKNDSLNILKSENGAYKTGIIDLI